ncbi:MAG: AraC family transcriptional regulator ligand-binding domain-containing protein, partial [Pseudolabrys sp.]
HLAHSFDLREIGLVYYVMASSDQLADALRNAERYSQINNEGVRLRFRMQDRTAVIALDYVNIDRNADVLAGCAFRRRRPRCPAHGDHVIRSMTTRAAHELDGAVGCVF